MEPTWDDTLDLPHGSYSIVNIQDYFEIIIKKKKKNFTENLIVQTFLNKIKTRIVFKIKTSYKLESLIPETMRLLGSTKKALIKIKTAKAYQN